MKRPAHRILAVVSLAPCLLVDLMWIHSYHLQPAPATYADRWMCSKGYVANGRGLLTIVYYDDAHGSTRPFDFRHWHNWGFSFDRWQGGSGWNGDWQYTSAVVPNWALFVLAAMPPMVIVWRWIRRKGNPAALCKTCGYDLRAHHPGDKCPECGTLIPAPPDATILPEPGSNP